MTIDAGLKPEGAPERSPIAGAGAPRASMQDRSAMVQRKMAVVARLLCGEPLESSPAKRMSLWPSYRMEGALPARRQPEGTLSATIREDEIAAEIQGGRDAWRMKLLSAEDRRHGAKSPLAPKRSRR